MDILFIGDELNHNTACWSSISFSCRSWFSSDRLLSWSSQAIQATRPYYPCVRLRNLKPIVIHDWYVLRFLNRRGRGTAHQQKEGVLMRECWDMFMSYDIKIKRPFLPLLMPIVGSIYPNPLMA